MKLILVIMKPFKLTELVDAVESNPDFPGITVLEAKGFGREKTALHSHVRAEDLRDFTDHVACFVAAPEEQVDDVVAQIQSIAYTGSAGDGKIFVLELEQAIRVQTGEVGEAALR